MSGFHFAVALTNVPHRLGQHMAGIATPIPRRCHDDVVLKRRQRSISSRRWIVLASKPVASAMRLAVRPVRAQSMSFTNPTEKLVHDTVDQSRPETPVTNPANIPRLRHFRTFPGKLQRPATAIAQADSLSAPFWRGLLRQRRSHCRSQSKLLGGATCASALGIGGGVLV
jgi:hypothetical protein